MKIEVYCKEDMKPYFIKGKKYMVDYMASTFYEKLMIDEKRRDIILSRLEFERYFSFNNKL